MTSDSDRKAAEEWISIPYAEFVRIDEHEKLVQAFVAGRSSVLKERSHTEYTIGFADGKAAALQELEQVAREAFEAGQDSLVMIEKVPFRDYWQQKTESKQ